MALKTRSITGRNITSWSISASDDGIYETIITSTSASLGTTTAPTFFKINTSAAYQYYKFNILESVGAPGVNIQHMQLYTVDNLSS